jgi:hypothetical protein
MTTPTWGQQPAPPSAGMSKTAKGCLGCGGASVFAFLLIVVIGLIMGPQKNSTDSAVTPASPGATAPASASAPGSTSSPVPRLTTGDVKSLDHGPQQGFASCVIQYGDAQQGSGTSTFTATVLNDSGRPYPPAPGATFGVTYQLSLTDANGTSYSVTEALGSGSRTAADNGGSNWFTDDQDGVKVSANSTEGVVASTLPVPLGQVTSATGNIIVTSQSDNSYLKQQDCAVRPASR